MGAKVPSSRIVTSIKHSGTLRTLSRGASTREQLNNGGCLSPGIVRQLHRAQKEMPLARSQNESVGEQGEFEERDGKKKCPSVPGHSGSGLSPAERKLGVISGSKGCH